MWDWEMEPWIEGDLFWHAVSLFRKKKKKKEKKGNFGIIFLKPN